MYVFGAWCLVRYHRPEKRLPEHSPVRSDYVSAQVIDWGLSYWMEWHYLVPL